MRFPAELLWSTENHSVLRNFENYILKGLKRFVTLRLFLLLSEENASSLSIPVLCIHLLYLPLSGAFLMASPPSYIYNRNPFSSLDRYYQTIILNRYFWNISLSLVRNCWPYYGCDKFSKMRLQSNQKQT